MDKKLRTGRMQKLKRRNNMFTTSPHQAGVVLILNYLEKRQCTYQKCTRKFSFMETVNGTIHKTSNVTNEMSMGVKGNCKGRLGGYE